MSQLLPGKDASGPAVWSRAHSFTLHEKGQLEPRRKRIHSPRPPALTTFLRFVDSTRRHNRPTRSPGRATAPKQTHNHLQRVTLRVMVSRTKGASAGHWAALGRYLERDGANLDH